MKKFFAITLLLISAFGVAAQRKTENVILVTLDGARWQEIFGGIDVELYKKIEKDAEKSQLFKTYNAPTATERREKLMPFFWRTWMKDYGSIAGNRTLGSEAKTTNNMLFSFPGYSEILTGEAHDDVINSNDRVQNKFPSFLQFLQKKLKLGGQQVASISSWEVMNEIATNAPDSFVINAGYEPFEARDAETKALSMQQFETPTPWTSVRHDYYTFKFAMSQMKNFHPRVVHIGLGETDDWAHNKNYEQMLGALHRTDAYFRELWQFVENDPQYKGKTTIVVTVDHGRGPTEKDWYSHGEDVAEARWIWMAFISPDSKLRGEWKNSPAVYQNQIAATLTKLLGFDYAEQNPNAGKPIETLFVK